MRKLAVLIEVSISTAAEDKGSYHDFQKFHLLWIGRRAPVDSTVSHNLHSNQAKATKNTLPWFMITVLTGHLRSHGERIMALSELLACFSHAQGVPLAAACDTILRLHCHSQSATFKTCRITVVNRETFPNPKMKQISKNETNESEKRETVCTSLLGEKPAA